MKVRAFSAPVFARAGWFSGWPHGVFLIGGILLLLARPFAAAATSAPETFADLVAKVSGAVVDITSSTMIAGSTAQQLPIVPKGSPLEKFFRDFRNRRNNAQKPGARRSQALGSGFVISPDGYIVTNNHVIDKADEIEISFHSGEVFKASVVGVDTKTDIALLKINSPKPLPYVSFGNSDLARVGDWVLAMGNPLGQGFSASAGIISARNRELSGAYDDFIQTDAAINRGNSGGPLFNLAGEVIGVNTAILSPNGGSIGIGFSMASNVVKGVVAQLRKYGETRRGWLGVRIQDVSGDVADAMGLASAHGALVTDVPPGPAADGGMKAGDVIERFDGNDIPDTRALVRIVGASEVGKTVPVEVFRKGKRVILQVTLGRREVAEATLPAPQTPSKTTFKQILGMTISTLNAELRDKLKLAKRATGLMVVDVDQASEAFTKGMRAGDLITEAGQQPVTTIAALESRISAVRDAGRKSLLLLVRRAGAPRFVALSVGK